MELMSQFATAETNKSAEIVVTLLEHLLGHGHTMWLDSFYDSTVLAWFMKSPPPKSSRLCWNLMLAGKMFLL
jgi:hypothetical protein